MEQKTFRQVSNYSNGSVYIGADAYILTTSNESLRQNNLVPYVIKDQDSNIISFEEFINYFKEHPRTCTIGLNMVSNGTKRSCAIASGEYTIEFFSLCVKMLKVMVLSTRTLHECGSAYGIYGRKVSTLKESNYGCVHKSITGVSTAIRELLDNFSSWLFYYLACPFMNTTARNNRIHTSLYQRDRNYMYDRLRGDSLYPLNALIDIALMQESLKSVKEKVLTKEFKMTVESLTINYTTISSYIVEAEKTLKLMYDLMSIIVDKLYKGTAIKRESKRLMDDGEINTFSIGSTIIANASKVKPGLYYNSDRWLTDVDLYTNPGLLYENILRSYAYCVTRIMNCNDYGGTSLFKEACTNFIKNRVRTEANLYLALGVCIARKLSYYRQSYSHPFWKSKDLKE